MIEDKEEQIKKEEMRVALQLNKARALGYMVGAVSLILSFHDNDCKIQLDDWDRLRRGLDSYDSAVRAILDEALERIEDTVSKHSAFDEGMDQLLKEKRT